MPSPCFGEPYRQKEIPWKDLTTQVPNDRPDARISMDHRVKPGGDERGSKAHPFGTMVAAKAAASSVGNGNTMVEVRSPAMSNKVAR
jgi:hypothetical protein